LDIDDSSRIDVCRIPNSNHPDWINVYIYAPPVNYDNMLEGAEGLETRIFPGEVPKELRNRLVNCLRGINAIRNEESPRGNDYRLAYHLDDERRVYRAVREL